METKRLFRQCCVNSFPPTVDDNKKTAYFFAQLIRRAHTQCSFCFLVINCRMQQNSAHTLEQFKFSFNKYFTHLFVLRVPPWFQPPFSQRRRRAYPLATNYVKVFLGVRCGDFKRGRCGVPIGYALRRCGRRRRWNIEISRVRCYGVQTDTYRALQNGGSPIGAWGKVQ